MKEQARSYKLFKEKYPSLEYVKENSDSIGETILNDKEIKVKSTSNFFKSGLLEIGDEFVNEFIEYDAD